MKIVIDIPEKTVNEIKDNVMFADNISSDIRWDITSAIVNGTPLKKGHWVGLEYDGYADGNPVYDIWECSECGWEHNGEDDTLTCYCPNCGANMRGDEE